MCPEMSSVVQCSVIFRIVARAGYELVSRGGEELESLAEEATYGAQDYLGVYKQEANTGARSVGDHLKRNSTALLLTRCLQVSGWFPEHLRGDLTSSEEFLSVAALVCRHIQSCSCNAYEINEFIRRGHSLIDCQNVELGGAVYPTIR